MADTRLDDLDPALAALYQPFVDGCATAFANQGLTGTVRIIQGWRDPAYRDQLHSSGVSDLNGSQSLHCICVGGKPASKAMDYGIFEENGAYVVDGTDPRYALAGEVAKSLGLVWGGDFVHPRPDPDHIQLA
jgi:hypothetical protein